MSRTAPASWHDAMHKVHGDVAWAWCWSIPLHLPPGPAGRPYLFATNYHSPLVLGVTYYPYPMKVGIVEEDSEGNLPTFELALSNHKRSIAEYFETVPSKESMMGKGVTGFLVNVDTPGDFMTFGFEIEQATLGDEWVVLRMESPRFFQHRIPQDRFNPHRCRWRFGGEECGYVVNAVAAFTTCSKDIDACVARGNDHVARNLPRLHPERFGGFKGIPQQ